MINICTECNYDRLEKEFVYCPKCGEFLPPHRARAGVETTRTVINSVDESKDESGETIYSIDFNMEDKEV